MSTVTLPHTFSNGTTADAQQVDDNFNAITAQVNGNLDDTNMKPGALTGASLASEAVKPSNSEGLVYAQHLFTSSFLYSGAGVTKASTNTVTVDTAVTYIKQTDGTMAVKQPASKTFTTSALSSTYYIDLQPDGTYWWNTSHSTQSGYIPIAEVATDASGNVSTITDKRSIGGTFVSILSPIAFDSLMSYDYLKSKQSPNLVVDSNFEAVSSTATVFSDALTSYTGSTVPAPWTLQSGSFTFGASGATSSVSSALISAGNPQWKPIMASDGSTKLAQTVEATFTTATNISTTNNMHIELRQDSLNRYYAYVANGNTFVLVKTVGGTDTSLSSVSQAITASTAYTITLSLDNTGLLTAKLYQGTNTSGTLLQTLTATDTSLTGGLLIGVGGDTGVVISNTSVTAPWANSWTIGGDSRVAWGLTQSAISGKYSPCYVGVGSGVTASVHQNVTGLVASTTYTLSGYMNTSSIGSSGVYTEIGWYNGSGANLGTSDSTHVTGTVSTERITQSSTSPAGTTNANVYLVIDDAGTGTFDNIQLELGSIATAYIPQTQRPATPLDLDPASTVGLANIVRALGGTGYKVQSGQVNVTVASAGTAVTQSVTFPSSFSSNPIVLVSPGYIGTNTATYVSLDISALSSTSMTVRANSGVAQTITVNWLALGK